MDSLRVLLLSSLVLIAAKAVVVSESISSTTAPSLSGSFATGLPSSVLSTISPSTITAAPSSLPISTSGVAPSATASAIPTSAPFPPIGSIPRQYSPEDLERLWDLVGPVEPPPFTTTPVPEASVTLPATPPPIFPTWYAQQPQDIFSNLKFPEGFIFGIDSAAYQVEGAAKSEGKGPTNWDWAGRQPGAIADGTNGDIVDLHYFLYKNDTARAAALGLTAHSFSISWARIFPFGTKDSPINQAGLDHYSDVIDYTLSQGLQPVVTLFHWDLPLALAAYYGGFTSPEIVDDYVNYATTVFKAFNGRVKTWYTFNEPHAYCPQTITYPFNTTYQAGLSALEAQYLCSYYVLKAHAGAVKAFRAMNISGEIAFKNDGFVGQPWRTNSTEDAEAVERNAAFYIGLFSEPVYGSGDWPEIVKEALPPSIFPRFTEEEKADLKGSADFFAIDLYRSLRIAAPPNGIAACAANPDDVNFPACNVNVFYDSETNWPLGYSPEHSADTWLMFTPQNLRYELKELKKRWPYDKIYVSEFGFANPEDGIRTDLSTVLIDADRTNYYMSYLGEFLLAIHEDGIPLGGTFAWAIVDNAEWASGTSTRFGIQYVNYTTLERTFKRSSIALSDFWKSHKA
ncbi:glycoside hydrolase family 1 protein [Gelatoporia subvermispora B]|uniref:Glycoside hydrolase family 1 protein n=1 Tax=Ceriporiopsis subvermispora (strain B) TaxID=914234 RepID=M2QT17_CERS8|nr:glycoside hydrolase family 1 protein [Gelatoporia subvermispora B]